MAITGESNVESKPSEGGLIGGESPTSTASRTSVSDDPALRKFYGDAISEAYRMKSELVAQHLSDIGMGK